MQEANNPSQTFHRKRKSISDVVESSMSPTRLVIPELALHYGSNNRNGLNFNVNRESHLNANIKRSIIRINKKKHPLDFFGNEADKGLDPSRRGRVIQGIGLYQFQGLQNLPLALQHPLTDRRRAPLSQQEQNPDNHQSHPQSINKPPKNEIYNNNRLHQVRSNETRSEEKRDKVVIEPRKFTAGAPTSKEYPMDLFSRGDEEAAIFPLRERDLPSRSLVTRDNSTKLKSRRGLNLDNLKFEGRLKGQEEVLMSPGRKQNEQTTTIERQYNSPSRKEANKKQQIISPVKIIVTNPTNPSPQTQRTPQTNPNQIFDVTFYNTKSSVLPPISK